MKNGDGHSLWYCYMNRLVRIMGYFGRREQCRCDKFNTPDDITKIEWFLT